MLLNASEALLISQVAKADNFTDIFDKIRFTACQGGRRFYWHCDEAGAELMVKNLETLGYKISRLPDPAIIMVEW